MTIGMTSSWQQGVKSVWLDAMLHLLLYTTFINTWSKPQLGYKSQLHSHSLCFTAKAPIHLETIGSNSVSEPKQISTFPRFDLHLLHHQRPLSKVSSIDLALSILHTRASCYQLIAAANQPHRDSDQKWPVAVGHPPQWSCGAPSQWGLVVVTWWHPRIQGIQVTHIFMGKSY